MLSEREMGSVGVVVAKRLDFLFFLFFFSCTLSALRVEFVACSVGKRCICGSNLIDTSHRFFVKSNYLGISYVSRI